MRALLTVIIILAIQFTVPPCIANINSCKLNGLTYTVVRTYSANSVGESFLETEDGASYLVVDLKVKTRCLLKLDTMPP